MKLRDLTKRQLYNLRRRCEKELKEYNQRNAINIDPVVIPEVWRSAFNAGLRAGLDQTP